MTDAMLIQYVQTVEGDSQHNLFFNVELGKAVLAYLSSDFL